MRKLTTVGAGLLLSATMMSSAMADEITMWTMEEQPDRWLGNSKSPMTLRPQLVTL